MVLSAPHLGCECSGVPALPLPPLIPPPIQGTVLTSPDSAIVSAELPPEIIVQNNGLPIVVTANGANKAVSAVEAELLYGLGQPLAAAGAIVTGAAIAEQIAPAAAAVLPGIAAVEAEAAKVTDAALIKSALEDAAVPDQEELETQQRAPCRIETTEESIHEGAHTVIHRPAHIIVNQPPTRLLINHPPLIVKPSAIVFHTGGKTIKTLITKEFMPRAIHVRPVIVRIVKPIEKKVLISKPVVPAFPQTIVHEAQIPPPCAYSHSALGSAIATAETLIKDSLPAPAAAALALTPVTAESAALQAAAASTPLLGLGAEALTGSQFLCWNNQVGFGPAAPVAPAPCSCTK